MESDGPFDLLRNPERRIIVRELVGHGETTTMETLAAAVVSRIDDHDERSARIRLHHVDLPRLEEAGVLDYDSRNGDVVPGDSAEELMQYLDVAGEETPRAAV